MILFQEGLCCLSRGYVVPAMRSFTKAIHLDPENASEAYVARASRWNTFVFLEGNAA